MFKLSRARHMFALRHKVVSLLRVHIPLPNKNLKLYKVNLPNLNVEPNKYIT